VFTITEQNIYNKRIGRLCQEDLRVFFVAISGKTYHNFISSHQLRCGVATRKNLPAPIGRALLLL